MSLPFEDCEPTKLTHIVVPKTWSTTPQPSAGTTCHVCGWDGKPATWWKTLKDEELRLGDIQNSTGCISCTLLTAVLKGCALDATGRLPESTRINVVLRHRVPLGSSSEKTPALPISASPQMKHGSYSRATMKSVIFLWTSPGGLCLSQTHQDSLPSIGHRGRYKSAYNRTKTVGYCNWKSLDRYLLDSSTSSLMDSKKALGSWKAHLCHKRPCISPSAIVGVVSAPSASPPQVLSVPTRPISHGLLCQTHSKMR